MEINEILNAPFTFTKRKDFLPCDTRPLWKSCLVIIALGISGKDSSASLKKIHVATWVTKKREHLDSFMKWAGKDERKRPDVRLEPDIDRVINLLVSNGLVFKSPGKISLTEHGKSLFNEINSNTVFLEEKKTLTTAKKHLSEAAVKRVFEGV